MSTQVETFSFVRREESLAKHTTMRVGGAAKWWAQPQTEDELRALLQAVQHDKLPLRVLGAGSNLVAEDDGFDGVILHLDKGFESSKVKGHKLIAGGAAYLPRLTKVALQNNLGNFEWACGIPGSVGGSLWGNAGARGFNGEGFEGREICADLESVVAFERNGEKHFLRRDEITFSYRKSSIGDLIVTEASFALRPLSEEQAKRHREAVKDLLAKRRATQPVNAASSGCIWKNPKVEGCAGAGALLESSGMKGYQIGGAQISEIHANFIVNTGNATCADVLALIDDVENRVLEKTGIQLEREVRLLK